MVSLEPEGFAVPMDIKEFRHSGLMASVRAARSLPYGVVQVSHQLPWPEQPAGEQQAMGTGTQEEEASSHHLGCISRPGTGHKG